MSKNVDILLGSLHDANENGLNVELVVPYLDLKEKQAVFTDLPSPTVPVFKLSSACHFFEGILDRQASSCRVGPGLNRFQGRSTVAQ